MANVKDFTDTQAEAVDAFKDAVLRLRNAFPDATITVEADEESVCLNTPFDIYVAPAAPKRLIRFS